ncbi:MAG: DciA family protein, partial [Phycisphaerales bacterium]
MSQAGWEHLERIRRVRVRASPGMDMRRLFLAEVPEMRRLRKQLASIAAAWMEVLPSELAGQARLEGVTRGVLRVGAPDSATAYLIDRALRGGAEARL